MFHNEGTIDYNKVVEVEMIEKIKHLILASKLGFVAALHQIAKWFQCALRHTRTAIKLAQGQIQYVSSWDSLGGILCVIDMNYIRQRFTLDSMEKEIIMFMIKAKEQYELIQIFSNYKQEVKLSLFAYLALVVAWFKNEHNKVCYLMIIGSYSQDFATFLDLVTSLAIVLKQREIEGELQQICTTILKVVYFCAYYHDCVNIMQQPLFLQQQLISTCCVRIGNKQQCQFKHWDPGKHNCVSYL
jgi:hypothetical protein